MKRVIVTIITALVAWAVLALGAKLMPPVDHGAPMLGWIVYMFFPILILMAFIEWWWEVMRGTR